MGYVTTSDGRLKTNVRNYEGALDTLMATRPVVYNFITNPDLDDVGFIAQELKEVYPYVVPGDPDGDVNVEPMSIDYGALTPLLTAAIQEQQSIIEKQQHQINELRSIVEEIRKN